MKYSYSDELSAFTLPAAEVWAEPKIKCGWCVPHIYMEAQSLHTEPPVPIPRIWKMKGSNPASILR